MARENRDMEKKATSSPARQTSCETKAKDNGRGNGNKQQRYNGKGRREPTQNRAPVDPSNGQSRRPAPQKSRAMDKRPRSRGLPASRREEMTLDQRAEFGSALPQGPKKVNLNHLINFTFAPRETEESRGSGGWRYRGRWTSRHPRYNKEQFLQANCQFVVKASGDYKQQSIDPDTLVDWDLIEQVRMLGHEMPSCPICLFPPAAAKITKCGHIYCWPCILHYISLGDKKWRKCPICYEAIMASDLKSVVAKSLKTYIVGDSITMRLMKREKGSVIIQPHIPDQIPVELPSAPSLKDVSDSDESCFAKLMVASPDQVKDYILMREKRELEKQLEEALEEFEKSFIQRALDLLKERDTTLDQTSASTGSTSSESVTDISANLSSNAVEKPDFEVPSFRSVPKDDCIVYASAFSDEELEETEDIEDKDDVDTKPGSPIPEESVPESDVSHMNDDKGHVGALQDDVKVCIVSELQTSATPSGEGATPSEEGTNIQDLHNESHSGESPGARQRKTSSKGSSIYFYQAEDGQHLYLGSLNARCLMQEYGGLERCPLTITAKLVEMEHISISQDLRNRMRHLQHLPLTCEVCVCELDLRPPTISQKTLAAFRTEIQKKKQKREKKARDEKRRERKIRQEEDRKSGIYTKPKYSLQSQRQFPSFSPGTSVSSQDGPSPRPESPAPSVDSVASSTYSAPLSEVQEDELIFGSPCDDVSASHQVDVASASSGGAVGGWPTVGSPDSQGGHRSFAQMLRDGAAKPISPVKPASYANSAQSHAASGTYRALSKDANSSNESDPEDYVPVPQYKDAFSNAIQDALDKAAQMSLKKGEDGERDMVSGGGSGGGGKKKKGRKKQQLLFSTAGPRFK